MRWLLLTIPLMVLIACGNDGERYQSFADFMSSPDWGDWQLVGRFGPDGPFELVEVTECEPSAPCRFEHEGQSHIYERFEGYRLAVLTLKGDGGRLSRIVLRTGAGG
ncbi:MAG: hypothetical protein KDK91_26575 [Gammaproteobacteria bacterium]|nr:hypothetical protein [Gammaproteobacteria bacterium]